MEPQDRHKLMLKIVIGSAWVDGHLEPSETRYLQTLMDRYHLTHDSELLALLEHPVSLRQTESWMVEYLADTTNEERQRLLAAIGKSVIADDSVLPPEHRLLDDYYVLMAEIPAHPQETPTVVKTLGSFVRQALKTLRDLSSGR